MDRTPYRAIILALVITAGSSLLLPFVASAQPNIPTMRNYMRTQIDMGFRGNIQSVRNYIASVSLEYPDSANKLSLVPLKEYSFDTAGRLISEVFYTTQGGTYRIERYAYDSEGRIVQAIMNNDSVRGESESVTLYRYDASGRLTDVTTYSGSRLETLVAEIAIRYSVSTIVISQTEDVHLQNNTYTTRMGLDDEGRVSYATLYKPGTERFVDSTVYYTGPAGYDDNGHPVIEGVELLYAGAGMPLVSVNRLLHAYNGIVLEEYQYSSPESESWLAYANGLASRYIENRKADSSAPFPSEEPSYVVLRLPNGKITGQVNCSDSTCFADITAFNDAGDIQTTQREAFRSFEDIRLGFRSYHLVDKQIYNYTYDKQGNWIERTISVLDHVTGYCIPSIIERRAITYYR